MDAYSKLDHATLVRNLNAVCSGLAMAIDQGGLRHGTPPALTYSDLEDDIPLALYRIAVAAGWIEEQVELEEQEYYSSKDADLFGGCLWLRASFKEWFLGLVVDTLTSLEATAESNRAVQDEYERTRREYALSGYNAKEAQPPQDTELENRAKQIINDFFDRSETIHTLTALAAAASEKKTDGKAYPISRVAVSRIYNGFGAGPAVRHIVASVINEIVPCTTHDLKRTKPTPQPKPKSSK